MTKRKGYSRRLTPSNKHHHELSASAVHPHGSGWAAFIYQAGGILLEKRKVPRPSAFKLIHRRERYQSHQFPGRRPQKCGDALSDLITHGNTESESYSPRQDARKTLEAGCQMDWLRQGLHKVQVSTRNTYASAALVCGDIKILAYRRINLPFRIIDRSDQCMRADVSR